MTLIILEKDINILDLVMQHLLVEDIFQVHREANMCKDNALWFL